MYETMNWIGWWAGDKTIKWNKKVKMPEKEENESWNKRGMEKNLLPDI